MFSLINTLLCILILFKLRDIRIYLDINQIRNDSVKQRNKYKDGKQK